MEVHIYSVKAKSQAGNQRDNNTRLGILKIYAFCQKKSAEGLGSRREHCWGNISVYENTPLKVVAILINGSRSRWSIVVTSLRSVLRLHANT